MATLFRLGTMFDEVYPVKDSEEYYITIQLKRPQNPNDTIYYNTAFIYLLRERCNDKNFHGDLSARFIPTQMRGQQNDKCKFVYDFDTCITGTYQQVYTAARQYETGSNYVGDTNYTLTMCMFPIFGLDTTINGSLNIINSDTLEKNNEDYIIATTIVSCDTVIQNLYSAVVCDTIVTYDTVKNSSLSETVDKFTYIYPNPASDKFAIQCSFKINDIEIVNPIGQVILQRKINAYFTDINVTDYEKGTYIVNIRTAGGNTQRKIVIN